MIREETRARVIRTLSTQIFNTTIKRPIIIFILRLNIEDIVDKSSIFLLSNLKDKRNGMKAIQWALMEATPAVRDSIRLAIREVALVANHRSIANFCSISRIPPVTDSSGSYFARGYILYKRIHARRLHGSKSILKDHKLKFRSGRKGSGGPIAQLSAEKVY